MYAKKLEKEQLADAWYTGDEDGAIHDFDDWYAETFVSKGSDATSTQTTSDKWKEYQDWLNEPPEISDEEIEKEIKSRYETPHYNSGFMDCAKWYREQLKQPKKD